MTFKALDTRLESIVVLVFNSGKIYMLLWGQFPYRYSYYTFQWKAIW